MTRTRERIPRQAERRIENKTCPRACYRGLMEVTGTSIASAGPDHDQGAAEEVWEDITEVSDTGVINSMHSGRSVPQ
jgi:hypothetical protein